MQVTVDDRRGTVRFPVRVQPRASRSETCGLIGGALKVRLQAPPVDGAANDSLIELMADLLGVARRQVRIVAGVASRSKVVEVEGVDRGRVEALAASGDARNRR